MPIDWRWRMLHLVGPGGYPGFLLSDWLRLARDNRFSVRPSYWVRGCSATASSLGSSAIASIERMRFGAAIAKSDVAPPLFILGHWRSGTTFLHQLIGLDGQFAFPNLYQVSLPHIFLSTESALSRVTSFQLPRVRPFDNVRQTWEMPNEDEIAVATITRRSPYLGCVYPKRMDDYDQYLTFRDVPQVEVDQWRAGLVHFLKKLTLKYQRPLVLKSPPHTARIRLLLQLFPNAKFVHIHRNPYTVFQSTVHTVERTLWLTRLQRSDQLDLEARTLRVYRDMYDRFFAERSEIPAGHFHEVCYEELEQDPVGQVREIYEALGLPGFTQTEPNLREYLASTAGYRKNKFSDPAPHLRERIASEWQRSFDEWRYPSEGGRNE